MVQSKELPLIAGRGNTSDEQERWSCHNTENMSVAYIVGNVQDLFCRIRKSRHIVAQTALQNDFLRPKSQYFSTDSYKSLSRLQHRTLTSVVLYHYPG